MSIASVVDISYESVKASDYDVGIFCSGYEERATFVPKQVRREQFPLLLVLGFQESRDLESRPENDRFYKYNWSFEPLILGANDESELLIQLRNLLSNQNARLRMLVDYSSMSRTWYASILNWARYACESVEIEIDFIYAAGVYPIDYPHRIISGVRAIPGCEGHPDPTNRSVAIFGLGYDKYSPLAVLDDLEPDEVLAFVTSPGVDDEALRKVLEVNENLLGQLDNRWTAFPLMSVQRVFAGLSELVSPYLEQNNVVIIPLGPKTHVLGSILVSMRYPDIACLHVVGKSSQPTLTAANGSVCAVRVRIEPYHN